MEDVADVEPVDPNPLPGMPALPCGLSDRQWQAAEGMRATDLLGAVAWPAMAMATSKGSSSNTSQGLKLYWIIGCDLCLSQQA